MCLLPQHRSNESTMPSPLVKVFIILAASLLAPLCAQAQAPRAQVVEDDVPRAVPVQPPGRTPPKAQVVDEEPSTPRTTQAPARATLKPTGPDEDLFDYAALAYSQKEYSLAAYNYNQYLTTYPDGRHGSEALFRMGECYLYQSKLDEAGRAYRDVVNRFPKAEVAPYAALRLGVLSYNRQDYKGAATYFTFCETKTTVQALTLQSAYYNSMAALKLNDTKKQIASLKTVVSIKKNNEYLQDALLSLANAYQAAGQNKEALPLFLELSDSAKTEELQADASLKAAVILTEQKKPDEAAELYKKVLNLRGATAQQRGASMYGSIASDYAKSDYDSVIEAYNRNAAIAPTDDLRPRLMVTVGNAYRMKKSYARAIDHTVKTTTQDISFIYKFSL